MTERRNGRNGNRTQDRATTGNGGPRLRPSAPLVRAPRARVKRTAEQWREWSRLIIDDATQVIREAGDKKDGLANRLFRATYPRDVMHGFDPEHEPSDEYRELAQHEGKSLNFDVRESLADYVRIGAMNAHRDDAAWDDLKWPYKHALVPLLGPFLEEVDGEQVRTIGLELFKEGLKIALQPNVSPTFVREWVKTKLPPSHTGRPRGANLTVPRTQRFAETGVMLGDEAKRAKFVENFRKAPKKAQRALLKDLKDTYEYLGVLLGEMDEPDEE